MRSSVASPPCVPRSTRALARASPATWGQSRDLRVSAQRGGGRTFEVTRFNQSLVGLLCKPEAGFRGTERGSAIEHRGVVSRQAAAAVNAEAPTRQGSMASWRGNGSKQGGRDGGREGNGLAFNLEELHPRSARATCLRPQRPGRRGAARTLVWVRISCPAETRSSIGRHHSAAWISAWTRSAGPTRFVCSARNSSATSRPAKYRSTRCCSTRPLPGDREDLRHAAGRPQVRAREGDQKPEQLPGLVQQDIWRPERASARGARRAPAPTLTYMCRDF